MVQYAELRSLAGLIVAGLVMFCSSYLNLLGTKFNECLDEVCATQVAAMLADIKRRSEATKEDPGASRTRPLPEQEETNALQKL